MHKFPYSYDPDLLYPGTALVTLPSFVLGNLAFTYMKIFIYVCNLYSNITINYQ